MLHNLFPGWDLPKTVEAAIEEILCGGDVKARLDKIEEHFPGVLAAAYKKAVLEIVNGAPQYRAEVLEDIFPGIIAEANRIIVRRSSPSGRRAWNRYASRVLYRSYTNTHTLVYEQDNGMGLLELYFWSQVLDVNPWLMFATGDPVTAWLLQETFDLDDAQQQAQPFTSDPNWNDDNSWPQADSLTVAQPDMVVNGGDDDQGQDRFTPIDLDHVAEIPQDNVPVEDRNGRQDDQPGQNVQQNDVWQNNDRDDSSTRDQDIQTDQRDADRYTPEPEPTRYEPESERYEPTPEPERYEEPVRYEAPEPTYEAPSYSEPDTQTYDPPSGND